MEHSAPLFKKILEINHIIRGRLNINHSELEKLYIGLQKDDERLIKKRTRQEEIIKTQIIKRNTIKYQLKRNSESLQKSFYPNTNKVSLLYKNQGGAYYIKARFYWACKQREVQVGSIPNVVEIINALILNNILKDLKQVSNKKLTWEKINKSPTLIDAIKMIASLKAQEYILRKLLHSKQNININFEQEEVPMEKETMQSSIAHDDHQHKNEEEANEGVEWYEKWRRDNL